jgi:hypothetical protein
MAVYLYLGDGILGIKKLQAKENSMYAKQGNLLAVLGLAGLTLALTTSGCDTQKGTLTATALLVPSATGPPGPRFIGSVTIQGRGFEPNHILTIQYLGIPGISGPVVSSVSPTTDGAGSFTFTERVGPPLSPPGDPPTGDPSDRDKVVSVSAHDPLSSVPSGVNPSTIVSAIPWVG